jgi:hypothetical protein
MVKREPVDWERVTAERKPDDPHKLEPVRSHVTVFDYTQRYCSCGWNVACATREQVMAASKRHLAWVRFVRRMAKKEGA